MNPTRVDIGALLMAGIPGPEMDNSTRDLIRNHGVRNFIIFKRNVKAPAQLKNLCSDIIRVCHDNGYGRPLLSIDQEGGTVTRLGEPWTQFQDARVLAESGNPESALSQFATTCAEELLDVGINMNLAPVLDICPKGEGFFMERRSFSDDPTEAAQLGSRLIAEMQNKGLAACAKHFPGLGAARIDPHHELPVVEKEEQQLLAEDLLPFRKAAEINVAAMMTSHTIYQNIDPDHPATLSLRILSGILREEVGYTGLIITDDLEMGAIANEHSVADAALASFKAGADMLLICKHHRNVCDTITCIHENLRNGHLPSEQFSTALNRIETVRRQYG